MITIFVMYKYIYIYKLCYLVDTSVLYKLFYLFFSCKISYIYRLCKDGC
jgi:hypothetical protein